MENATKALLIAAAVLIVMLVISLSIFIVTSSSEKLNTTQMTELEIQAFNQKFISYKGTKVSTEKVSALLKTVSNNNASNSHKVAVKLSGLGQTCDSTSYVITDEKNRVIKCNSGNIVSLEEIRNLIKKSAYNYTVSFYYASSYSATIGNNTHLNPIVGGVLLVMIEKN